MRRDTSVVVRSEGKRSAQFSLLSSIAAGAMIANRFALYLSGDVPRAGHGVTRAIVLLALVGTPATVSASKGATLSSVLVVSNILPIAIIIVLGLARFSKRLELIHRAEIVGRLAKRLALDGTAGQHHL